LVDPGEGIKISVVYAANTILPIMMQGSALGVSSIDNYKTEQRREINKIPRWLDYMWSILMAALVIVGAGLNWKSYLRTKKDPEKWLATAFSGMSVLLIWIAVYTIFLEPLPTPPF
jgi:hypothetical protein